MQESGGLQWCSHNDYVDDQKDCTFVFHSSRDHTNQFFILLLNLTLTVFKI